MSNATDALAALEGLSKIDPMSSTAFIDVQRLSAIATTHAILEQAAATDRHTEVITVLMATTMTNAQAKVILEALTGLGSRMKI